MWQHISASWARDIHTLSWTHIIQYRKTCTVFPYCCRRTPGQTPGDCIKQDTNTLSWGCTCQFKSAANLSCAEQAQSHNLACIWSELCNNIIVPQMNQFGLHKHCPFAQERITDLAIVIGGCTGWCHSMKAGTTSPSSPDCSWRWARRGAACHLLLPCKCFSG